MFVNKMQLLYYNNHLLNRYIVREVLEHDFYHLIFGNVRDRFYQYHDLVTNQAFDLHFVNNLEQMMSVTNQINLHRDHNHTQNHR